MVAWELNFSRQAVRDAGHLKAAGLKAKAEKLLSLLAEDPFRNPPSYEKLTGDMAGSYSRRINLQHRLVYDVFVAERKVLVLRLWSHYE